MTTDLRAAKASILEELNIGGRSLASNTTDRPQTVEAGRSKEGKRWEDMTQDEQRDKKRADARRISNAAWERMTPDEQREKKRQDARRKSQAAWERMTPDEQREKKRRDARRKSQAAWDRMTPDQRAVEERTYANTHRSHQVDGRVGANPPK
jgi:hypothetical protein